MSSTTRSTASPRANRATCPSAAARRSAAGRATPSWDFVAVGRGHDTAYWTEFLRALHKVDPDMPVNIEHEDQELDQLEGLRFAANTLIEAEKAASEPAMAGSASSARPASRPSASSNRPRPRGTVSWPWRRATRAGRASLPSTGRAGARVVCRRHRRPRGRGRLQPAAELAPRRVEHPRGRGGQARARREAVAPWTPREARDGCATPSAAAGVVFMEAFHYPYHPLFRRVCALLDRRAVGEVRRIRAILRMPAPPDSDPRWSRRARWRRDDGPRVLQRLGAAAARPVRRRGAARRQGPAVRSGRTSGRRRAPLLRGRPTRAGRPGRAAAT